jgi:23S rRNA (pseudouridine1915-N3)-methyltransferase
MKATIRIVGRKPPTESWLTQATHVYESRLQQSIELTTTWHKTDEQLIASTQKDRAKGHAILTLDPNGKMCSSEDFCNLFYDAMDKGGSRLTLLIGGAEGLPGRVKYARYNSFDISTIH